MENGHVRDGDAHQEVAAAPAIETADLVVPFKVALDAELRVAMMQALVKYLLYLRGQIPCVYDEFYGLVRKNQHEQKHIDQATNGSRKRKLTSGPMKKASKFFERAEEMLDANLVSMFQRDVQTVAIVFGAMVASPREVWRVDFCSPLASEDGKTTAVAAATSAESLPRERVMALCVQKLIRTVLTYGTQHFSSPLATTSIHLLVLAEKSYLPVDGFTPKQQFRLRLPKAKKSQRTHTIEIHSAAAGVLHERSGGCEDGSPSSSAPPRDASSRDGDDPFIWYQCSQPLQGVSRVS